jgi:NB-ARC domain
VNVTGSRDFRSGHYDVTGSEGAGQYNVTVSGGRGVYIGDHGIQVNLFTGEPPPGPVVAGNVPQAPRAFRPREDLMVRLRSAGPGVPVVRAVTGMRGVGKTQLAAAYARERIDADWRLVAWVSAEDTPAILNGLAVVAARLGMDRPGVALEIVGAEVRNRLEADGDRCLIVFDNVTDPDAVRPYLPSAGHAQAVITSTDISTAGLGAPVSVDVFTEAESLGFLAERTGRTDQEGAADLAEELGQLPLALAQAAAVMSAQHLTYPVCVPTQPRGTSSGRRATPTRAASPRRSACPSTPSPAPTRTAWPASCSTSSPCSPRRASPVTCSTSARRPASSPRRPRPRPRPARRQTHRRRTERRPPRRRSTRR